MWEEEVVGEQVKKIKKIVWNKKQQKRKIKEKEKGE